ncbi:MAG: hypothetical protein NTX50_04620 [Candidatus Sumerlaeota bacterium]|nr:hypothetical protein [Candidatus Sumerlaeota bacterium]
MNHSYPSQIVRAAILGVLFWAGFTAQAQNPSLTVDVSQPGPKISPMLYGIFFEEINHAGDGGLYAELVRNRNFDDAKTPVSWEMQLRGTAQGKMALCTDKPLNPNRPNSLQIDATEARDGGLVCAVNEGFWGMGLKKDAKYRLALFARCSDGYQGGLEIGLAGLGETYAKGTIKSLGAEWKRYECEMKSSAAAAAAQLAIGVNAPGTVWLTCVSLFPVDTWKNRPNGLRPDLAEKLAEMKPAFNRFPGGCYVEGGSWLRDAFRWKTTVVPIEERPGHLNEPWAYRSTDGLGYHEYLQMSEDLGAEPLYVCNVGMAHRESCPMDKLDEWVQEALDSIEYANGPETSKWGVLRAKNGHPKPFNMKYMEIGN